MLEPLLVLTVLNCFFVFGSTLTTCALWWQYRHRKCCYEKPKTAGQTHGTRDKAKGKASKVKTVECGKSKVCFDSGAKCGKSRKRESKTDLKCFSRQTVCVREPKMTVSEASQTNETKSLVMEFSTVQKVVQILDNDSDMPVPKLFVTNSACKKDQERKKCTVGVELKCPTHS